MKNALLVSFLMSCGLSQIATAQNTPVPAKPAMGMEMGMEKMPMQMPMKKDGAKPAMGMGMDKMPMPMKKVKRRATTVLSSTSI